MQALKDLLCLLLKAGHLSLLLLLNVLDDLGQLLLDLDQVLLHVLRHAPVGRVDKDLLEMRQHRLFGEVEDEPVGLAWVLLAGIGQQVRDQGDHMLLLGAEAVRLAALERLVERHGLVRERACTVPGRDVLWSEGEAEALIDLVGDSPTILLVLGIWILLD